nr:MAG TPA: hypothetical protein [Caudoviricetes sp.]
MIIIKFPSNFVDPGSNINDLWHFFKGYVTSLYF